MLKRLASVIGFALPSCLTRPLFRLVGHRVGRNAKLPLFSYLYAGRMEIGNDVDVRCFVFVSVAELTLGSNTIVSFGAQIKGHKGFCTGDNCFIGAHTIIHCDEHVKFGFYSGVGPRCTIYTHGSFLPVTMGYPAIFAEVTLDDFVWTAMGVLFLPGAQVGRNCLINPGVVVRGKIPPNTRLEVSEAALKRLDQGKLLRFARRSSSHYHQAIVRSFFTGQRMSWKEESGATIFKGEGGVEFRSLPESNELELWDGGRRIVGYDLDRFYAGNSRHRLHRKFLGFMRRRFGLTLRVKYQ